MIARTKVGTYPLQIIIENIKTKEETLIIVDAFKKDLLETCFVIILIIDYLYNIRISTGFMQLKKYLLALMKAS